MKRKKNTIAGKLKKKLVWLKIPVWGEKLQRTKKLHEWKNHFRRGTKISVDEKKKTLNKRKELSSWTNNYTGKNTSGEIKCITHINDEKAL